MVSIDQSMITKGRANAAEEAKVTAIELKGTYLDTRQINNFFSHCTGNTWLVGLAVCNTISAAKVDVEKQLEAAMLDLLTSTRLKREQVCCCIATTPPPTPRPYFWS